MRDYFEMGLALLIIGIAALGGFALILIVQPWFWLAMITLILVSAL